MQNKRFGPRNGRMREQRFLHSDAFVALLQHSDGLAVPRASHRDSIVHAHVPFHRNPARHS